MVREARFSWDDVRQAGGERPVITDWDEDDLDDFDPGVPPKRRRSKSRPQSSTSPDPESPSSDGRNTE